MSEFRCSKQPPPQDQLKQIKRWSGVSLLASQLAGSAELAPVRWREWAGGTAGGVWGCGAQWFDMFWFLQIYKERKSVWTELCVLYCLHAFKKERSVCSEVIKYNNRGFAVSLIDLLRAVSLWWLMLALVALVSGGKWTECCSTNSLWSSWTSFGQNVTNIRSLFLCNRSTSFFFFRVMVMLHVSI